MNTRYIIEQFHPTFLNPALIFGLIILYFFNFCYTVTNNCKAKIFMKRERRVGKESLSKGKHGSLADPVFILFLSALHFSPLFSLSIPLSIAFSLYLCLPTKGHIYVFIIKKKVFAIMTTVIVFGLCT